MKLTRLACCLFVLLSSLAAFAFSPIKAEAATPSVYYGAFVAYAPATFSALTTFETDAQKAVAIDMWYQQWGAKDGTQYFQTSWMDTVRNHGSIPMVTWEPWDPRRGTAQPTYRLQNIYNGKFDSYLTRWAKDSKAWGHPYFLRFAHEMNGNWYPWDEGVNGNKPGDYVKAWWHVHDIFVNNGVTNVTWVWSPNVEYTGSTPLAGLYPGDSSVDWSGMDGYNWGTSQPGKSWQTFSQVFASTYNDILQVSPNRPLMVAETASTESGGDKAAWITDAYQTQLPTNFPKIKAIVWFNQNKETDWRIESSATAQSAFAASIANLYYTTNSYATLSQSPIPPP